MALTALYLRTLEQHGMEAADVPSTWYEDTRVWTRIVSCHAVPVEQVLVVTRVCWLLLYSRDRRAAVFHNSVTMETNPTY